MSRWSDGRTGSKGELGSLGALAVSGRRSPFRRSQMPAKTRARTSAALKETLVSDSPFEGPEVDDADEPEGEDVVRDGFVLDFINGSDHLQENPKEQVRQRIARALFHEYGICVE